MIKTEFLDMSKILQHGNVSKLFNAVEEHGGTIRFVGGAVRDSLAGISGFDLDLATDLSPDELVEACQDNAIKTMPIGMKLNTIGVIINNQILEVTSLRKNIVMQDGRSVVEYTDDWSADASMRDLTINAVYADLRGNVFDYYNGISDLEKGIVRFIGKPEDRIREDYLRILRFFRFYAIFGKTAIDTPSLKACIKYKDSLRNIAIERVRDELFKILITPNATSVMKIIFDNDILGFFLPKSKHLDALQRLSSLVQDANYQGNFLRRLFVLYQPTASIAENIANSLRFTKKQKETFVNWAKIEISKENMATPTERLKFIYRYGKDFCIDKILITLAIFNIEYANLSQILTEIEGAIVPIFPIKGRDIINLGIAPNTQVGKILNTLEQQWIDSNFSLNRDELLQSVK